MIATFALLTQPASNLPSDASALERSISALESCISALDSKAKSLASSSAGWEPWAWVFTSLVVIGILMELWLIWDEHREDIETWALTFFGIHRTVRPPTRRLVVEYVSVVLVAGGIIGELGINIEVASINAQLRGVDAQLRSKNAELRRSSDRLVALVTREAERERLDRTRLEALVAPRRLPSELQVAVAEPLEQFNGRNVVISSYVLDAESEILGEEICSALGIAKIHCIPNPGSITIFGKPLKGVKVAGSNLKFARALELSLRDNGHLDIAGPEQRIIPSIIGSRTEELGIRTDRKVDATIFVGVKPPILKLPVP